MRVIANQADGENSDAKPHGDSYVPQICIRHARTGPCFEVENRDHFHPSGPYLRQADWEPRGFKAKACRAGGVIQKLRREN